MKKLAKLAKKTIKHFGKSMIEFDDFNLDVDAYVKSIMEKVKVSSLNDLISEENIVLEQSKPIVSISNESIVNASIIDANLSRYEKSDKYTVILPLMKSKGISIFDYINPNEIGYFLRTTLLSRVFKLVKNNWSELVKDDSDTTSVMYIPDNIILFDDDSDTLKKPVYFNLLILAFPDTNTIEESMTGEEKEKIDVDEFITMRMISDIIEAAVKCKCKDIRLKPFSVKFLRKHKSEVINTLKAIIDSTRVHEHIKSVSLFVDNIDEYCSLGKTLIYDTIESSNED
jgi:hypothetical protein